MSIDLFGYELPVECRTILARLLNDIHCKSDLLDRLMKEDICVTVKDFKVVESTIGNKCLDRV